MHRFDHATLLFFHGNGEIAADYDDIAPLFNRAGVNFVVADYRGYGCSQGRPTASSMMTDCHRILDYVDRWKADNGYTGPTLVMGRSLGSASALELAHTHADRLAGLIIESGFARTGPLLQRLGAPWQPLGSRAGRGFANIDKIRTFRNPTLIIHAEFDRIIPFSEGQALYDASGAEEKRLVKIPGADHNDIFFRGMAPYLKAVADLTRKLG
jgi:hypothetical protein